MTEPEIQTHESYGMASFRRMTGHKDNLFGCGVPCDRTVRLEIKTGGMKREQSEIKFVADKPVCIVEFSPAQFVELLTNVSEGQGIPCTFIFANGREVEGAPKQDALTEEKQHFKRDVAGQFDNAFDLLHKAQNRLLEKRVTKQAKEEIVLDLGNVRGAIESNIPSIISKFDETMDKKVAEAKAEIDALKTGLLSDAKRA